MSLLKSFGGYLAVLTILVLAICVWGQHQKINGLVSSLELSNDIIARMQQERSLADKTTQAFHERREAIKHDAETQQKIAQDALKDSGSWADTVLPESVRRMLSGETISATDVHPANGAD